MTRGSVVDYVISLGQGGAATPKPPKSPKPAKTAAPVGTSQPTPPPNATPEATPAAASAGPTAGPAGTSEPGAATAAPGAATVAPSFVPTTLPTAGAWPSSAPSPTVLASPLLSPSPFPSDELTLLGDFLCLDLRTAREHLEAAGLLVGAMIPHDPPPDDSWIIHGQLPKSGESVKVGSAVDLVLLDPLEPCPAG